MADGNIDYAKAPHELATDLETHKYIEAGKILDYFQGTVRTSVAQGAVSDNIDHLKANSHLPHFDLIMGTDGENHEYLSKVTVSPTKDSKPEVVWEDKSPHTAAPKDKPATPPAKNALLDWIDKHNPLKGILDKAAKQGNSK